MEFTQDTLFADEEDPSESAPAERRRKYRRPLTAEERGRVIELYESGTPLTVICAAIGCTNQAIYSALTRAGVKLRNSSRGRLRTLCEVCGEPMRYVPPSSRAKGLGRFCSMACMGEAKRLPPSQRADGATELRCSRCKQMKPVDDFYPARNGRGRDYNCRLCVAEDRAERAKIPEDPISIRKRKLRESYGITMEEYDELYLRQDGCCAICGIQKDPWQPGVGLEGRKRFLVVDHCHANGHIRGLLCANCNNGLGHFHDSVRAMLAAVAYLGRDAALRSAVALVLPSFIAAPT